MRTDYGRIMAKSQIHIPIPDIYVSNAWLSGEIIVDCWKIMDWGHAIYSCQEFNLKYTKICVFGPLNRTIIWDIFEKSNHHMSIVHGHVQWNSIGKFPDKFSCYYIIGTSQLLLSCVHSSLVDYLGQVIQIKNYPSTFYCIFKLV